jgi:hypothetical protein
MEGQSIDPVQHDQSITQDSQRLPAIEAGEAVGEMLLHCGEPAAIAQLVEHSVERRVYPQRFQDSVSGFDE